MEGRREGSHILGSIYCGSYRKKKGRFIHIRVHLLRILWREGVMILVLP